MARLTPTVRDYMTLKPPLDRRARSAFRSAEPHEQYEIRHLPVIREGKLTGILSPRPRARAQPARRSRDVGGGRRNDAGSVHRPAECPPARRGPYDGRTTLWFGGGDRGWDHPRRIHDDGRFARPRRRARSAASARHRPAGYAENGQASIMSAPSAGSAGEFRRFSESAAGSVLARRRASLSSARAQRRGPRPPTRRARSRSARHLVGNVLEGAFVATGNDDGAYPRAVRREDLFLDAAHGQYLASKGNLAGDGEIHGERRARRLRSHGDHDRRPADGPSFGIAPAGTWT